MPRVVNLSSFFPWAPAALVAAVLINPGTAWAQLFGGDDEARKAIIELRARVEADRRASDAQLQRINQDFARLSDETTPTRRGLLELSNQIETLRAEQARMRGQSEQLARDVSELQRQQKDVLSALNERLRQLEPTTVALDGQEFRVKPEEKAEFEQAMESVRKAAFEQAMAGFNGFLKRFPGSGYRPSALFWLGNAQYASSAFRDAIASYQRLLTESPEHMRVPEARLAIANCQMELKDVKSAKRTLEEVVKMHPQSEAAATAKDRLTRLR